MAFFLLELFLGFLIVGNMNSQLKYLYILLIVFPLVFENCSGDAANIPGFPAPVGILSGDANLNRPANNSTLPNDARIAPERTAILSNLGISELPEGSTVEVTVKVENTGSNTWFKAEGLYKLGSVNDNPAWGLTRVDLPEDVPSGGEVEFKFTIRAPRKPRSFTGDYTVNFQWQMLKEGVVWFGQKTASELITVHYSPSQYISKLYTEALGRAPDQEGWQYHLNYFINRACNASSLSDAAKNIFNSPEYAGLGYSPEQKVITLYRAMLSRDPTPGGYAFHLNLLNTSGINTVIDNFEITDEFDEITGLYCDGKHQPWRSGAPIDVNKCGLGGNESCVMTQADLQGLLNAAQSSCGTVSLPQGVIVALDSKLTVPQCVTLKTENLNSRAAYAKMARLYRKNQTDDYLVVMEPGSILQNIFIDGQRGTLHIGSTGFDSTKTKGDNNLLLNGGASIVEYNRISNSWGLSTVLVGGESWFYHSHYNYYSVPNFYDSTRACTGTNIQGNLITAYASEHRKYMGIDLWIDGISNHCEDAAITANEIIDATDVALISFVGHPAGDEFTEKSQKSRIMNNIIFNSGNSAYAALGTQQSHQENASPPDKDGQIVTLFGLLEIGIYRPINYNFRGHDVSNNLVWTSPGAHYDYGLLIGTDSWFSNSSKADMDNGYGGSYNNNTSGTQFINTVGGIIINGIVDTEVLGNTFNSVLGESWACKDPYNISHNPRGNVILGLYFDKFGTDDGNFPPRHGESYPGSIQPSETGPQIVPGNCMFRYKDYHPDPSQ